ncbi:Rox3-domain-containing protein [Parathielavia hyrcaniae]|uniref:Mediator of RNA polymerase II transcription subunit 19 n=1 Tax=Parathielavia hyrcaniae TaxID=113614 RepID=A0AAN6T4Q1_9PEZI|nr:Rox3-domain-containing protein [Parathielavia hyrcaniae]
MARVDCFASFDGDSREMRALLASVVFGNLVNVFDSPAHPRPRPQLSEDLFELYGLTRLAAEVARVLPNGEKNALRKTYKGHIKKLGVQGHFDEVKQDPQREEGLCFLAKLPEDVWDVHFARGKEIDNGFSSEVRQKLSRAVTMGKGSVPKSVWDSSVLGDLAPGKGEKRAESARPTAPNTPLPTAAVLPRPKVGTPLPQEAARSKRNVMKRSYGDSSFEGYGDGLPDDETGAETGYSTGEGDMVSAQKRRKKVLINGQKLFDEEPNADPGTDPSGERVVCQPDPAAGVGRWHHWYLGAYQRQAVPPVC